MDNVYKFKYLGALIAADSQQCFDINARVSMAMHRCGQLRHVFDSPFMGDRLKLRLYKVAVCSLMTYGCEAWTLSEKVMRKLNGANSQMLSRITGQTVRQEARSCTTSYNILKHIRVMRLNYLGLILRGNPNSLTFDAVHQQFQMGTPGNLLMDTPHT